MTGVNKSDFDTFGDDDLFFVVTRHHILKHTLGVCYCIQRFDLITTGALIAP